MKFRFQDFEIWKDSIVITKKLLALAKHLEETKHFAFADQLRRAVLSISNNIAEGSGSDSKRDFAHFLTISKRSTFECANIILVLEQLEKVTSEKSEEYLTQLDLLSRKITNFKKSLID